MIKPHRAVQRRCRIYLWSEVGEASVAELPD
jgi:hypothetical protein